MLHPAASCHILSYRIMSCHVLSCHIMLLSYEKVDVVELDRDEGINRCVNEMGGYVNEDGEFVNLATPTTSPPGMGPRDLATRAPTEAAPAAADDAATAAADSATTAAADNAAAALDGGGGGGGNEEDEWGLAAWFDARSDFEIGRWSLIVTDSH